MEYMVVNCFGAIIEYFAVYAFLWIFFDQHTGRKAWRMVLHFICPVLFLIFASYVSSVYLRPTLFILVSWFIAYGFEGDIWQKLFSVSVFQVCLVLLEFLIAFLVSPVADFSNESVYLSCNILVKIVTLAAIAVLFFFSKKHQVYFQNAKKKHIFMLFSFSLTSFFLVMLIDYLLSLLGNTTYFVLECFSILLCLVANIGLYYLFYQLSVGEEAKARLKLLDFHLSKGKEAQTYITHSYREIRKASHDMNRYLSAIYGLLQQGDVHGAMLELQKRQLEISDNQLFDTGYPVLNSILSYKIQLAQSQGIQPQLFWNLNISLKLNLTDLAVILSNALDNAIEAASQVTKAPPFLSISVKSKENYLVIHICNNTVNCPTIIDGKITTTKQDKENHGLGLESIKKIAKQYDGDAFIECQDNFFTLTVVLKNISGEENKETELIEWKKSCKAM